MSMAQMMSQSHSTYKQSDMSVTKEERYAFIVDWHDNQADLIRQYLFTFYPKDSSVEMVSGKYF